MIQSESNPRPNGLQRGAATLRHRVHGKWKQVYTYELKLHEVAASPGVASEKHDSWQKSRLERQKTYGKFGLRETAAVNNTH